MSLTTTLYLIRHGQTVSNKNHIKQGIHIDDYLNTQGIQQVERLAPVFQQINLDVLFTSYLHRAEESAAIIRNNIPNQIPILHDFRLRERDFGSLTGKTEDDWNTIIPGYQDAERMQTYDYRPFGGESIVEVRRRAISAFLDMIQNYEQKNVGVLTHDGIIRLVLFHFPEIPRIYHEHQNDELDIANTDVYEWPIDVETIPTLRSLLV